MRAMQENISELVVDKNARLVYLQLLAPNRARYLQAELLSVVNPVALPSSAPQSAERTPSNDKVYNMCIQMPCVPVLVSSEALLQFYTLFNSLSAFFFQFTQSCCTTSLIGHRLVYEMMLYRMNWRLQGCPFKHKLQKCWTTKNRHAGNMKHSRRTTKTILSTLQSLPFLWRHQVRFRCSPRGPIRFIW